MDAATDTFVAYANEQLLQKYPGKVTEAEWSAWLHEPGLPKFATAATSSRFVAVDAGREQWLAGKLEAAKLDSARWGTHEWVHFLEGLPETLDAKRLAQLDAAFHFSGAKNGEIAQRWYPLTVRNGYATARADMEKFLIGIGRRKLIEPTWKELVKTPNGLAFARQVFAKAKPGYHPITATTVQALLDKATANTQAQ
jgi:hypothetical protein